MFDAVGVAVGLTIAEQCFVVGDAVAVVGGLDFPWGTGLFHIPIWNARVVVVTRSWALKWKPWISHPFGLPRR